MDPSTSHTVEDRNMRFDTLQSFVFAAAMLASVFSGCASPTRLAYAPLGAREEPAAKRPFATQPAPATSAAPIRVSVIDGPGGYFHGPMDVVPLGGRGALTLDPGGSGGRNAKWDAKSGVWSPIAAPPFAGGTSAVELSDGRVLAVGDGSAVYDPAVDAWTTPRGAWAIARIGPTMALLAGEDRVLVAGGFRLAPRSGETRVEEIEVFDPANNSFRVIAKQATDSLACVTSARGTGALLLEGQMSSDSTVSALRAWRFDASTESIVHAADPPAALIGGQGVACIARSDGTVFVWSVRPSTGGSDLVVASYDGRSNSWATSGTSHFVEGSIHAAVSFGENRVAFIAHSFEEVDSRTLQWSLPQPIAIRDGLGAFDGAVALGEGDALLVGRTASIRIQRAP
jgi:hypothetical protein